jgi:predicted RNA binding protein YcfA (HicA-like mRNA interferase family)
MPMTKREAERILKDLGYMLAKKRGKGSHDLWQKSGERPITLPSHSKELSRQVENSIREAMKKG